MTKRKCIHISIGVIGVISFILGLILLLLPKAAVLPSGIGIVCLSLASGMLLPNPISLVALIAGILMIIFPAGSSIGIGIAMICLGIAMAVINYISWHKYTTKTLPVVE